MQRFYQTGRQSRHTRKPKHGWQVRHRPYQIQPIAICPVLPGESLQHALFQSRAVSDPVRNPLIGWWLEYYWFYVKHRDLDEELTDDLKAMVLDADKDMSAHFSSGVVAHYYNGHGINYVDHCLDRVVKEYFRMEGEESLDFALDGIPLARLQTESWLDSAMLDSDMVAPDQKIDVQDGGTDPDFVSAKQVEEAMRRWMFERANNITEMSYEEWLSTYGVRGRSVELRKPELLRYVRDWTYPSNTVDPSDGSPSSALSWSISERADKRRFFEEPGFIFGCTVARPKVYLSKQTGFAASQLYTAFSWLPALLDNDPYTSLAKIAEGDGPLPDVGEDYWVDLRDLYMYGDQFLNFELTATDAGLVALPTASLERRYPSSADVNALFVDQDPQTKVLIRQDGVLDLSILGRLYDGTPSRRTA